MSLLPLLSVSLGLVFLASDFLSLMPPVGFSFFGSFFGNGLVALAESAKLISELDAAEAVKSPSAAAR